MDRILRCRQGSDGVWFGRISSLLFADNVLLASSQDLQHVPVCMSECEAAAIRISTSKSTAILLGWKRLNALSKLVETPCLIKEQEFWVFFTSVILITVVSHSHINMVFPKDESKLSSYKISKNLHAGGGSI